MLDGFYTFGGGHFWEDVFYYQKWRIQRNTTSKKYRLLDNWDICRFEGSFEECRQAFIRFIEVFELPRQRGPMVIMLPGFGQSKNIFKPLWRVLIKHNFSAAAVNCPTMQKGLDAHVRQLTFFLNNMEDVSEVSFVTSGVGNVFLKKLFMQDAPWQKKLKIGRIVEVCPLNHGSSLLTRLSKNKLMAFVLGPLAAELEPQQIEKLRPLPKRIETGIILRRCIFKSIWQKIFAPNGAAVDAESERKFEKATDAIEISSCRLNIFDTFQVLNSVVKFLTTGKF